MKKILICFICLIAGFTSAFAGEHPQAHFGEFGLEYFPTAEGYQKYVGQTVVYMPEAKPSYDDKKFTELFNGQFGTQYVIQKVSGNNKKVKFELVEKDNPKSKIKFEFLNYDEYYSYGKNTFANTEKYRVPLFFVDKFNEAASQFQGKPLKGAGDTYLTIKGLKMGYATEGEGYPVPSYEIENPLAKKTVIIPISQADDYAKNIGRVFSDPDCNFTFTIIDKKTQKGGLGTEEIYKLLNSSTGKTEEAKRSIGSYGTSYGDSPVDYAKRQFADAKRGHYIATLSKVEKPSNSAIRYGKTTEVKDKDVTKFSYVDNVIDIVIFATGTKFSFELKNISPNSIKIIWDEAAFVDADGSTSKVMHVGTKFSERNSSQPATTVIKGAKIEDVATPTDRVYYSDTLKEWTSKSMFPTEGKLKDKQVQLMLPIQIKDVVNEYIFVFDLTYVLNHPELLNNPEF